jgi:hypothetical protein
MNGGFAGDSWATVPFAADNPDDATPAVRRRPSRGLLAVLAEADEPGEPYGGVPIHDETDI